MTDLKTIQTTLRISLAFNIILTSCVIGFSILSQQRLEKLNDTIKNNKPTVIVPASVPIEGLKVLEVSNLPANLEVIYE